MENETRGAGKVERDGLTTAWSRRHIAFGKSETFGKRSVPSCPAYPCRCSSRVLECGAQGFRKDLGSRSARFGPWLLNESANEWHERARSNSFMWSRAYTRS